MTDRIIYELTGHTNPTDLLTLADGQAVFGDKVITPQQFYEPTDPDFQAAMERARDYLNTFNYNLNGGGFYGGAPTLMCPAGPAYLMHDRVDFSHTGKIVGEGDGFNGPGSGGCTHFKWTGATSGFANQGTNTNGITGVDVTSHAGSGGFTIQDMCLDGGFGGTTESDNHGLVLRIASRATDVYIKNWPGEAVKAWAGTVNGVGAVGGNLSTTRLVGIKTEGNRGGIDIRGSDANVITTINCQGYQNRQFGLLDDNGAGSNTHIGWHCASNGVVTGPWAQTQCSYSGNFYALAWGGDPTVAPSGTTADTANWFYIEPGAPIANLNPAWVSTANTFRAGGDYLTINNAGAYFLNCYSEGGGFSQFGPTTIVADGTIGDQYYRGGNRMVPRSDGLSFANTGSANLYLDSRFGSEGHIAVRDGSFNVVGFIDISAGGVQLSAASGNVYFKLGGSFVSHIDPSGFYYDSGGNKVLGVRQTGTAAVATDPATTMALVNDLRAKLVTHGLVS